MDSEEIRDVIVVGGGVAGRTAAIFTARHGYDTLVCDTGESLVRRNAHLENFPGFPTGVNARRLLDMIAEQAERAGATRIDARVTRIADDADGFEIETGVGDRYRSTFVIAATKNAVDYLRELDDIELVDRGKWFVATDERGRTDVEGLYAAGRLAQRPHQAIVCAGSGAEVAVTLLEDDENPFYHDWVAPSGYFTDRDRDLPPGCAEIDEAERARREEETMADTRERFATRHPDAQETHPSLTE